MDTELIMVASPTMLESFEPVVPSKTTERDVLDLLLQRYSSVRAGTTADRWVRAEHVRSKLASGTYLTRIADFIAADKWPGVPYGAKLALHGHEVKVSRSDWLTELRDPDKAEAFKPFMHYWWLVVSDAAIVRPGELPAGWGLLVAQKGKLRAKVRAPLLTPEPLPLDLSISLMASASRTAHREPLHRDAPTGSAPDWTRICTWCGTLSPCTTHQPRKVADNAL